MRRPPLGLACALAWLASPVLAQEPVPPAPDPVQAADQALVALVEQVSRAFVVVGQGSGVIISPEGEILTNHHVSGSRQVGQAWVVIRPGKVFETARIVGTDRRGDLALLKLEGPGPYPYLPLGDSDALEVGEQVLALGNPFGLGKDATPHVSLGVISALHRFKGGYSDAIMTDTPINPGNSGGPLVDMQGRLVGINGQIEVRHGPRVNTGVGYAVPSNQIRAFLPALRQGGLVAHARLTGVVIGDLPGGGGARLRQVMPESAAARAGLRDGDIVRAADGRRVHNGDRLRGIVGSLPAGATLPLQVRRGARDLEVELTLASRNPEFADTGAAFLGIFVSDAEQGSGAEVEQVMPNSPAAQADLRAGDVIRLLNGRRVSGSDALIASLRGYRPGQRITLTVLRGENLVEVVAVLGRKEPERRERRRRRE